MKAPLYGNPLRSGSIRLGGWFPVRAGVILVVASLVVLICFLTKEFILGLLIAVGVVVYVSIFEIPFGAEDLTLMTRARRRFTHMRRVDSGETLFLGSTFTAQNKGLTLRPTQALAMVLSAWAPRCSSFTTPALISCR